MTKSLLITGASTGIGAATARLAARAGWDVIVHYNTSHAAAQTVAQAITDSGQKALPLSADLSTPEGPEHLFAQIDAAGWAINGLVNNAGIVDTKATLADMTHARLRQMFDINVIGLILTTQGAVARMPDGGVIVNISSAAARLGSANQYIDYAASKGAIDTLTKGLAEELAPRNIRVNGLRPGLIDTDIHAKGGEPDRAARLAPNVPMKRTGSPEEVAQGILWLLSDQASYVTGTTLDVSGGR